MRNPLVAHERFTNKSAVLDAKRKYSEGVLHRNGQSVAIIYLDAVSKGRSTFKDENQENEDRKQKRIEMF